jgi:hypothetical protein
MVTASSSVNSEHNNTLTQTSSQEYLWALTGDILHQWLKYHSHRLPAPKKFRYKRSNSPLLVLNSAQSAENYKRKQSRFLVRSFTGVKVGTNKHCRFRWFVLTQSDQALSEGIIFGHEFHKFITWLRYYCPDVQYQVVEHEQGKVSQITGNPRHNYHVLTYGSYGSKLPLRLIREYWLKHFKSTCTGMAEIVDIQKAVYYVAGYLSQKEKFVRSWCSQGWVFRGWLGISQAYKRQYKEYPRQELVKLSLMSPGTRQFELEYLSETGYLSEHYETKTEKCLTGMGIEYERVKPVLTDEQKALIRLYRVQKSGAISISFLNRLVRGVEYASVSQ